MYNLDRRIYLWWRIVKIHNLCPGYICLKCSHWKQLFHFFIKPIKEVGLHNIVL